MTDFVVIKKTIQFHTCSTCEGTGVKSRTFRKMNFVEDCPECEKGMKPFTVSEEVSLVDALKELNLLLEKQMLQFMEIESKEGIVPVKKINQSI